MKVIHLIFSFHTGGAETLLVDILNEQVIAAEVDLIIINECYNKELVGKINEKVKIYFVNRKEGSRNLYKIFKLNILLYFLKADVIHCHNHNIIPFLFSIFRKKAWLTLHSTGIPTSYLNKYVKLFSISNAVKCDLLERENIISEVIYNGIYTDKILAKQNLILNKKFKIVQVGRLDSAIKGQNLVIEAINALKLQGINNIQFDMIGSGKSELNLKELVAKYKLENQINFLGHRNRDYIYTHLQKYDLLVQPSLFEGFGLTIIEGMAAKVPVLVSNINGPVEIIENGKYGYVFKNNDIQSLSKSLIEIIENYKSDVVLNKVEKAYLHVCKKFSVKLTANQYLEQYYEIGKTYSEK